MGDIWHIKRIMDIYSNSKTKVPVASARRYLTSMNRVDPSQPYTRIAIDANATNGMKDIIISITLRKREFISPITLRIPSILSPRILIPRPQMTAVKII